MNLSNLAYIDTESDSAQDHIISQVSGEVAGLAFNDLCRMIGGRFPDCKMQEEAPIAYEFFMKLFGVNL